MVEKAKIVRFQSPKLLDRRLAKFAVHFKNTGTIPLKAEGAIQIKGSFGQKETLRLKRAEVLPQKTRVFLTEWENAPLIGFFSAEAKLRYGPKKRILSSKASFITFPWKIALVIITILVATFFGERWFRSRRKVEKA